MRRLAMIVLAALMACAAPVTPAAASTSGYTEPTLHRGEHGAAVADLQRLLGVSDDGIFGPITAGAVRAFQRSHHLTPTGAADGTARAELRVSRLWGVGDAHQIITVTNRSWSSQYAVLRTFQLTAGGWREAFPPVTAHLGVHGFGRPKHEGDLSTPVGAFHIGTAFGTGSDPGVQIAYRRTTSRDVWVDDVHSRYYDTWQTGTRLDATHALVHGHRTHVEWLRQPRAYALALDIDTNPRHVAGRGSAIFLHVSLGHATAGCVSIAESRLRAILRWLDPAAHPRVVMGPESALWTRGASGRR